MAQITTKLIQELRAKTNAGMMDCKRALEAAGGDLNEAVDALRKSGIAKAAKRSDRVASEGVVLLKEASPYVYLAELNSETDFVAKNDKFQKLGSDVIALLETDKTFDFDAFLDKPLAEGKTVKETVENLSGVIGEKIELKRTTIVEASSDSEIGTYVHSNNKIGVTVILKNGKKDVAKDIAMHIAATSPQYVQRDDVPSDVVDREKKVLKEQVLNEGKPEQIADKIVEGKLRKFYEEICLLEQNFVKNPDIKVGDLLKEESKSSGKDVTVSKFVCFRIGS
jgi:elongation factor Ts